MNCVLKEFSYKKLYWVSRVYCKTVCAGEAHKEKKVFFNIECVSESQALLTNNNTVKEQRMTGKDFLKDSNEMKCSGKKSWDVDKMRKKECQANFKEWQKELLRFLLFVKFTLIMNYYLVVVGYGFFAQGY